MAARPEGPARPEGTAPHTPLEDAQGLVFGTATVALALSLLVHAGLVTGQVAGVAALVAYTTGWAYGPVFWALNLPFYVFALMRMGWRFTALSLGCVTVVSVLVELLPGLLPFGDVRPWAASVWFGIVAGFGFVAIFRHRASMGGVGIVALWLQEARGWRAGYVQLAVDLCIFAAAFAILDPRTVLLSLPGVVILNVMIALNHRPGRYAG